jgi:cytokinin dehydrogenase
MTTKLLLTFAICRLIVTVGLTVDPSELLLLGVDGQLSVDQFDVETASLDFGLLTRAEPMAVLHPGSADDIARLVRAAYISSHGFTVSARGHGHSINGQAQTSNGVVIEMSGGSRGSRFGLRKLDKPQVSIKEKHVDVWGGELWIDVLRSTLEHGLAPKSWTDYLYLSVGGTLSNGGISGQAFNHGPQISNVYELDVVTGWSYNNIHDISCMAGFSLFLVFFNSKFFHHNLVLGFLFFSLTIIYIFFDTR